MNRVVFAAALLLASAATAQNFPAHPLRLIVPLAPGGGNDGAARIVGHKLGEALGEQVIVDNRPGGGSLIASELMLKAPPDGHTILLISSGGRRVWVAPKTVCTAQKSHLKWQPRPASTSPTGR